MKKKEKTAIHGMTNTELKAALGEVNTKLTSLRVTRSDSRSRNVREGRNLHRKRAVILTVLKEKELMHER